MLISLVLNIVFLLLRITAFGVPFDIIIDDGTVQKGSEQTSDSARPGDQLTTGTQAQSADRKQKEPP